MSNPVISFRLSKYHLARGLQIIRGLEPDYILTSPSRIVRDIFMDYLAKMTINKSVKVPQHFIDEIETSLYTPKRVNTLNQLIKTTPRQPKKFNLPKIEKSTISSVEDFTPPTEWTEGD